MASGLLPPLVCSGCLGGAWLLACARPSTSPPLLIPLLLCASSAFVAPLLLTTTSPHAAAPAYSMLYWMALLLGWLLPETLGRAIESGHFSPLRRLSSALRSSLRLYAIVLVALLVSSISLLLSLGLSVDSIQAAARTLVNGTGLLLISLFLGHGIVSLPSSLWLLASPHTCLASECFRLGVIDEQHISAARKLREALHRLTAADASAPPPAARSEAERSRWEVRAPLMHTYELASR